MRYFFLIWAGISRNPARTFYTIASMVVAFLLFGVLSGVNAAFEQVTAKAHADRLYVTGRNSSQLLPISMQPQIGKIPGVSKVIPAFDFLGHSSLQSPFGIIATFPEQALSVYPEIKQSTDALNSKRHQLTDALVGISLANRFGWKTGDRITVTSGIPKTDGTTEWPLYIIGTFSDSELGDLSLLTRNVIMNYDYFDRARLLDRGTVSGFILQISDAKQAASIGAAVDANFANSSFETKTASEKEFAATVVQQIADINLFADLIIGAVFFALLFLTSNTMSQSVRDRIPEYAVLKTIGFSDSAILMLVLFEIPCLVCYSSGRWSAACCGYLPATRSTARHLQFA